MKSSGRIFTLVVVLVLGVPSYAGPVAQKIAMSGKI